MRRGLEICVGNAASLVAVQDTPIDRIELCAALPLGGLTPSVGLTHRAVEDGHDVHVLIRPRGGGFHYTNSELSIMETDIASLRDCGIAGVVIGAALEDRRLDEVALRRLIHAAEGLHLTLHRVIDEAPDQLEAVRVARSLGFGRILTSGGALAAVSGIEMLLKMKDAAGPGMTIMAGAGITPDSAPVLMEAGISDLHASCSAPQKGKGLFGSTAEPVTERACVLALAQAMGRPV